MDRQSKKERSDMLLSELLEPLPTEEKIKCGPKIPKESRGYRRIRFSSTIEIWKCVIV